MNEEKKIDEIFPLTTVTFSSNMSEPASAKGQRVKMPPVGDHPLLSPTLIV